MAKRGQESFMDQHSPESLNGDSTHQAPNTRAAVKRAKHSDSRPTPDLLGIPAELRNEIYRYVLIKEHHINVREDRKLPSLLRTNHRLRNEAKSIFLENTFTLWIYRLNFEPQPEHWFWTQAPDENCILEFLGWCRWPPFVEWLQKYHERWCPVGMMLGDGWHKVKEGLILNTAFKLVEIMKMEPWNEVAKTLQLFAILGSRCRHTIEFEDDPAVDF